MSTTPQTTSAYATPATGGTPTGSKEPSRAGTPNPNAPVEKQPDEGSKLKTFLSILRKFIGVADLAAIRFSLPAQLLEPVPNLGKSLYTRSIYPWVVGWKW
jgi:oxysterol-binding protein-related protein 9/10/11